MTSILKSHILLWDRLGNSSWKRGAENRLSILWKSQAFEELVQLQTESKSYILKNLLLTKDSEIFRFRYLGMMYWNILFTQLKCFPLMLFQPLYYIKNLSSASVYPVTYERKWYKLKHSGNFPLKHFNTAKHCFIYIFVEEASSFREFLSLTFRYSFRISFGKPASSYYTTTSF